MAKTKQQKGAIIDVLEGAFKNASSAVFVRFSKIGVNDESAMRRALRAEGMSYKVAKKSLIRRALEKLGHEHKHVPLEGEVSVAYSSSEDVTAPARRIWQFAKQLGAEKLAIMGGLLEGRLVGREEMEAIATIPPLQTLRGMFVNVINSPIAGLAVALKAIADNRSS